LIVALDQFHDTAAAAALFNDGLIEGESPKA
jgi:hypothetical protein